jgi:tetratricopeptide (TPR) repeat protein
MPNKFKIQNRKSETYIEFNDLVIRICLGFRCPILGFVFFTSCAYFNTYYNTQNYFNQGMKLVTSDTLKYDSEFFDKTIEKATLVIVKYPTSRWVDDALLLMGVAYYYKGDFARSLEKLDVYCQNYPGSGNYPMARYYKGLAHYRENKYSDAIVALTEAAGSKRFKKKARIALCYVYNKQGDYNALVSAARELMKQPLALKEKKDVLTLIGEAQFKLGLYDDALATFDKLVVMSRDVEEKKKLKLKIATIYLELNKYEQSMKFLEGENDPEFLVLEGELKKELGKLDEARELYIEIISRGQSEYASRAYYELGRIYEEADSVETAIAYYDSAMMKSSSEYGLRSKNKADVLKRAVSLLKETENVDRALFMLAELYFVDLKDNKKALYIYRRVYTEYPKSIWASKALYAEFWITKNIIKDDTLAVKIAAELTALYPATEYVASAESLMRSGLVDTADSKKMDELRVVPDSAGDGHDQ